MTKFEKYLIKCKHQKCDDGYIINESIIIEQDHVINGQIPIKLKYVHGNIYADKCGLTSLKNFPNNIHSIDLDDNCITNFEESEIKNVKGFLLLRNNEITCLKNSPKRCSYINLENNPLSTLVYVPRKTDITNMNQFYIPNLEEKELEWYNNSVNHTNRNKELLQYYLENNLNTDNLIFDDENMNISNKGITKYQL